ncbi:hypothetical protein B296_00018083 [Ensete ventricosum]|uniref:DUF834 domain-containing protein n=1 Tax=Ensete ventricosum TaxID=4639 RepID=A0A427AYT8_ENSVE|nr:hypothetical protein B296_00018083 [Ensete ventricosum]
MHLTIVEEDVGEETGSGSKRQGSSDAAGVGGEEGSSNNNDDCMDCRGRSGRAMAMMVAKATTTSRVVVIVAAACVGCRGRWDGSNGKRGRGSGEGTSVAKESMLGSSGWHMGWKSHRKQRRDIWEATTAIGDANTATWQRRGDGGTTVGGSSKGAAGNEGRRFRTAAGKRRV